MHGKTILYLINGLGVASKDSYDLKIDELMPNFSMLMRNYLYATLENVSYNYNNGFRNFSLGNNLLPTYDRVEKDTTLPNNETVTNIAIDVINNRTKLHIFCFLDNYQVINHVVRLVQIIRPKGNFSIFIHVVLRQKEALSYDEILKMIQQLNDKITLEKNVEIGLVVGERKINTEQFHTVLKKGMGEKWPDFSRKINYIKNLDVPPRELDSFYVHEGFKLENNDISLILNYEDVDINEFVGRITNVKLYTLFPMKDYPYAINIYEEIPPKEYFSKILEAFNLNCLVLTTPDRIENINYNLCGLKTTRSKNITYQTIVEVKNDLEKILNDKYDYIIFDYDLDKFDKMTDMKEFLMKIDEEISSIYTICDQKNYSMFISSLYGLYKEYIIGTNKKVKLDYSIEIPAVVIYEKAPASKYAMKYGTSHQLSNTIFSSIMNDPSIPNLYRKKGIISFFKD